MFEENERTKKWLEKFNQLMEESAAKMLSHTDKNRSLTTSM